MTSFIDEVRITVRAGDGGNGCLSFRREKFIPRGGPDGGDGGRGGSVIFKVYDRCSTLSDFRYKKSIQAERGKNGSGQNKHGRAGEDVIIPVPVGTVVYVENEPLALCDLTRAGQEYLVCKGGHGGAGNARYKSSTNRAPRQTGDGEPGEVLDLRLELKLLADVGLVGLPNAGKSSLIRALSHATPKVADYPFTTLRPYLGIVEVGSYSQFVMADIPGLIKGASHGHGLGLRFLKHISRCKILLHCVDPMNPEKSVLESIEEIQGELKEYGRECVEKKQIVVITKLDCMTESEGRDLLKSIEGQINKKNIFNQGDVVVVGISSQQKQGLDILKHLIVNELELNEGV